MDSIKEPDFDSEPHNTFLYNESFDLKRDCTNSCAEPFDLRPSVEIREEIITKIEKVQKKLDSSTRSRENSL